MFLGGTQVLQANATFLGGGQCKRFTSKQHFLGEQKLYKQTQRFLRQRKRFTIKHDVSWGNITVLKANATFFWVSLGFTSKRNIS